jgi:hypothetical protein
MVFLTLVLVNILAKFRLKEKESIFIFIFFGRKKRQVCIVDQIRISQ